MTEYITEDIDYTGCHPVIAEHLKNNKAILCRVGDEDSFKLSSKMMVIGYLATNDYPYITGASRYYKYAEAPWYYKYAEPIQRKIAKVKKASEIMKLLEDDGYSVDGNGSWSKAGKYTFYPNMWKYCGREKSINHYWRVCWLEEVENADFNK